MKRYFTLTVILLASNLVKAQQSDKMRLASMAFWFLDYNTNILSIYDSVQYEYPNRHTGGGTEQHFNVNEQTSVQYAALQYYSQLSVLPVLQPSSRYAIKRIPENRQVILSVIDHNTEYPYNYLHLADTSLQFDDHGNLLKRTVTNYPDSSAKSYTYKSYTYNDRNLLIADTLHNIFRTEDKIKRTFYNTYTYDVKGRCTRQTNFNSQDQQQNAITYTYDSLSRLTRLDKLDFFDRVMESRRFEYFENGEVQQETWYTADNNYNLVLSSQWTTQHFIGYRKITKSTWTDSLQWTPEEITMQSLNAFGQITDEQKSLRSETLLPNGTYWYVKQQTLSQYDSNGRILFKDFRLYHPFLDDLQSVETTTYHWEPFMNDSAHDAIMIDCFPVPFDQKLTVNFELEQKGICEINLLNMFGEQVLHKEMFGVAGVNQFSLETTHLVPGNYLLHIQNGKSMAATKILKN